MEAQLIERLEIFVDMNSSLYRALILAASLEEKGKGKGRTDERKPRRHERTMRLPHSYRCTRSE